MKTNDPEIFMRFASETGLEIFQLLLRRSESLGNETPFDDMFGAMIAATAVCLANVIRPAVEVAPNRATAADSFIALCTKQTRRMLDPVITGEN